MSTAQQVPLLPEIANGKASLPERLIELALAQNIDADKLAKLMELKLTWDREEARKAYIAALQQFKANPPQINKTKHVQFPSSKGGDVDYWHAQLEDIVPLIGEALRAVGITHSWRTSDANGKTTVTCVFTHKDGHSQDESTLSGPPDTSGGKNNVQAIGSTVTYLQRYTLLSACGLAAKGTDNDGRTEGLSETAIDEFCCGMMDARSFEELQQRFAEAWKVAKAADDKEAQKRFMALKESKKKELREFHQ